MTSKLPSLSLPPIMIGCHPLVCPTTGWSGHEEESRASRRSLNGPPGLLRDAHPKQVSLPSVSLGVVLSSDSNPFFSCPKHFLQPIFWDLSFSPLYVHVSPYQFCYSLGGLASYCVWAKMSSTLTLNCRIKVSVRLNACTHRCFQFEIWKCMRR